MTNKIIPKVEFKIPPTIQVLGTIWYFLNPDKKEWDWKDRVLDKYPKLKKKFYQTQDINERKKIVSEFFLNYEKKNKNKIECKKNQFQKSWNIINDKYMKAISEVVEIDWSKDCENMTAWITLNPICPRDIQKRSFDVFFKFTAGKGKEVGVHEILHFIYFEKWKQVFKKYNEKEFDYPHLVWKLSEIVPKAIMSDIRIQRAFKHKPEVYKVWERTKINNKPLLDYIQEFYDKKKDFASFLKESYEFVKKYEQELNRAS